jgi:integrase
MSGLYRLAMREHPPLVMVNPFADLELPEIEPHSVDFYEHDEAQALYEAAGEISAQWHTFIELGMDVGLRLQEILGLHGHRVDWLRGKITVVDVMTRQGLRQWPKSKKSHRVVPVPPATLERMSALMTGRDRDALVFAAAGGGPLSDVNFRNRVWYPAVEAAGVRRFAPRIMRHTPPPGWCRTGCRCTTSKPCLGMNPSPPPSGTPTLPRTLIAGSPRRGRAAARQPRHDHLLFAQRHPRRRRRRP